MSPAPRERLEAWLIYVNLVLTFLLYSTVARLAKASGTDWSPWLFTAFDRALPFDTTLFPVYMLAFASSTFLMAAVYWKAGLEPLRRYFVAGVVTMLGCFALYLMFPCTADPLLASALPIEPSLAFEVVRRMPLHNACPSMHVVNGWMVYRLYAKTFERGRLPNLLFFLAMAASTMLLKVHFLADVLAGWAVGELAVRWLMDNDAVMALAPVRATVLGPRALAVQLALAGLLFGVHGEKYRRRHAPAAPVGGKAP